MRSAIAVSVLLLLVAACDERPDAPLPITAPASPGLTLKNLPSSASSVCRANVALRDDMISRGSDATPQDDRAALDNVISDVCN